MVFLLGVLTEQLQKEFNAKYDDVAVKDLFVETTTPKPQLQCVYFTVKDIPHELLKYLYIMGNKYRNDLFDICWRKQLQCSSTNLTFQEVYTNVCQPVLNDCEEILLSLQEKTITLENVDKYFQKFEHISDMEDNLSKLCEGIQEYFPGTRVLRAKRWVRDVVNHIQEYKRIYHYWNVAMIILNLKESLKLHGDFTAIKMIGTQVHYIVFKIKNLNLKRSRD